jgi:hypothetical protein
MGVLRFAQNDWLGVRGRWKSKAKADPYGMTTRKAKARTAKFEGEL